MSDDEIPEADRIAGAPHPRHAPALVGQDAAEAAFLDAHASGRMHHAWLITGPRGTGKATLAWRIARFMLEHGDDAPGLLGAPTSLDIASDAPVARRIAALSEPRLALIRRGWNEKTRKHRQDIVVEDVRRLAPFLGMSAADGGWRVVIVDAADEMNTAAANALLKLLEEPPQKTVLLLVAHAPGRLLPTIRSRCRELRLKPLGVDALATVLASAGCDAAGRETMLAELSAGSAGEAIEMLNEGGPDLYEGLVATLGSMPGMNRRAALALADQAAGRGAEARFALLLRLMDRVMHRLARAGATAHLPAEAARGEAEMLQRLAPDASAGRAWAEASARIMARAAHGRGVNLDPAQVVFDMLLALDATATRRTGANR